MGELKGDEFFRKIERIARSQPGDVISQVKYLRERLRRGEVTENQILRAAQLGDPTAISMIDYQGDQEPTVEKIGEVTSEVINLSSADKIDRAELIVKVSLALIRTYLENAPQGEDIQDYLGVFSQLETAIVRKDAEFNYDVLSVVAVGYTDLDLEISEMDDLDNLNFTDKLLNMSHAIRYNLSPLESLQLNFNGQMMPSDSLLEEMDTDLAEIARNVLSEIPFEQVSATIRNTIGEGILQKREGKIAKANTLRKRIEGEELLEEDVRWLAKIDYHPARIVYPDEEVARIPELDQFIQLFVFSSEKIIAFGLVDLVQMLEKLAKEENDQMATNIFLKLLEQFQAGHLRDNSLYLSKNIKALKVAKYRTEDQTEMAEYDELEVFGQWDDPLSAIAYNLENTLEREHISGLGINLYRDIIAISKYITEIDVSMKLEDMGFPYSFDKNDVVRDIITRSILKHLL